MRRQTCELCDYMGDTEFIKGYRIIPEEVTEQAGVTRYKTVRLCPNCWNELSSWYSANISDVTYDTAFKRFRTRSGSEMIKEYEVAFSRFREYKSRRDIYTTQP